MCIMSRSDGLDRVWSIMAKVRVCMLTTHFDEACARVPWRRASMIARRAASCS